MSEKNSLANLVTVAKNGNAKSAKPKNKGGRPATGKRSNDEFVNRSYWVKEDTTLDVEYQLLALKRQGVGLDRSDVVERGMRAWVALKQGESEAQVIAILEGEG